MNLRSHIGGRIRTHREAAGVTLADLARRLVTHPSNIQRWEQGRVSPNWKSLTRIAEALEVTVEDLVAESPVDAMSGPPQVRLGASASLESHDESPQAALYSLSAGPTLGRGPVAVLMRLLQDPRLEALRDALGELPDDLTAWEARQIGEMIRAYIRGRQ